MKASIGLVDAGPTIVATENYIACPSESATNGFVMVRIYPAMAQFALPESYVVAVSGQLLEATGARSLGNVI